MGVLAFPARRRVMPRGLAHNLDGLAHDLRNVMASLELCAEVMAQPDVLMPGHGYLAGEVRAVADAAIGLMRRIGYLTEGDAGLRPGWAVREAGSGGEVAEILGNLEGMLRRVAGAGVRVEVECAPCRGRLAMTQDDLGRVLVNLVRNAGEATGKRGRIRVTAQMAGGQSFAMPGQAMAESQFVVISVQDNGPGVPKELAEQIFEPGFSTKGLMYAGTGQARAVGRGLGLAVARDLVEAAGGALVLAASPRGARFEMKLPLTNVMRSWASRAQFDGLGGQA
jgi:signal transduction histidine kinase